MFLDQESSIEAWTEIALQDALQEISGKARTKTSAASAHGD